MKTILYSIKDEKAEAFMAPFSFRTDGEAIRAFDDSVQKVGTPIHDHPEDFTLFRVGEFDIEMGMISPIRPYSLANASQFAKKGE